MNRRAGYSLFEVLVGFAVMTVVLGALLPGQARLSRQVATREDHVLALDLARSRLDAMGIAAPYPTGAAHEIYGTWRLDTEVRDAAPLFYVTVSVSNASGTELARVDAVRVRP